MNDPRRPEDRPAPNWDRDDERIDKRTDVGWSPPTDRERPPPGDDD